MTRHIFLLRHGATQKENGRKYIGQSDPPLGEEGHQQAVRLRQALADSDIRAAYSSDLSRCVRTAEIVLGRRGMAVVAKPDLREVAMGEWEGHFRSDIASLFPEEYKAHGEDPENHRVKGGESLRECHERVVEAFDDIVATSQGDILIAAHGSTNRLILCHLLGMPIGNLFRLGQDHGCMNIIRLDDTGYRLTLLNHQP